MKNITGTDAAAKWATNLGNATTQITNGVNGVTAAPGMAAARQKAAYTAGVAAAVDKWAARVSGVTLEAWKADMIGKGIPRVADGATKAQPKMATFLDQLLTYEKNNLASLPPRGTKSQNKTRMAAWFDTMSSFKRA